MNRIKLTFVIAFLTSAFSAAAQDTLPKFNVVNVGNENIIISWSNEYDIVRQISIQTSHDSLKNYRTIITMADPTSKKNGYVDTKALNDHMFYRLFVLLGSGEYFFTEPRKPVLDTSNGFVTAPVARPVPNGKRPDFIPSFYVYTNKDGYVYINLPDADRKNYRIRFYEEDDDFLFELKNIKEAGLTLDKTNFLHAGWFKFELFNDDKLIEKNKVYLMKDF